MASRWSRYRAELNKINSDINHYRSLGDFQLADCLQARKDRLIRTLEGRRRGSRVRASSCNAIGNSRAPLYDDDDNSRAPIHDDDENNSEEDGEEEEEEEYVDVVNDVPEDPDDPMGEPEDASDDPPLFGQGKEEPPLGTENYAQFRTDVTFREIIGALIILKTCHKMPWSLFLSIVQFIQALLVTECKMLPKTHAQLKKFFKDIVGIETHRVVYCCVCWTVAEILPDMHDKPSAVKFCECGHDVASDAKEGRGNFIWLPTLPQLRAFVRRGKLYEVVRDYAQQLLQVFRGERFRGVLDRGNIPVVLGSDAAPAGRYTGKSIYPVLMALGNVPNRLAQSYAILCSVFVGKKEDEPPPQVLYDLTIGELNELEDKKIKWSATEKKAIEVVGLGGDQPELRKLANQSTSGYMSCLYCLEKGFWDGTAVRFGFKRHENPAEERTAEKRYRAADEADELNKDYRKQEKVDGIMGYPLLQETRSFYASLSYICDLMHVVLLGFLRDIFYSLVNGVGKRHNLRRQTADGFKG